MNQPSLEQVERTISRKPESSPDFETMWTSIEREVEKRRHSISRQNHRASMKRKFIPATATAAICLLIAVPVFAAVNSDWDIFGRTGVNNAINHGFGEKLDMSVQSAGATMNLHGVVTDGEQMDMLFTMDVPGMPDAYDSVGFDQIKLSDADGDSKEPYALIEREPETGKLKGMFELKDELQKSKQNLNLNASNLVFYNYKDLPLAGEIKEGSKLVLPSSQQDYTGVTIRSIVRDKDKVTVKYAISSSLQDPDHLDPHLFVTSGSHTYQSITRATLPPDGIDLQCQSTFNIPENEWQDAELHLTHLQEIHKVPGTWAFDFKADGKKASEVMYSKDLQVEDQAKSTNLNLKQLLVTPLQIRIPYIQLEDNSAKGDLRYNNITLQLGDRQIKGENVHTGTFEKEYLKEYLNEGYLRFESPEWFKDWSGVPMKVVFSDLEITKRDTSKNWYDLQSPTAAEQRMEMNLDDRKVIFTYYKEGSDLVVKSSSQDPTFKGVSQSTMRVNGKEIVPELNSSPPSLGPFTKVERYSDIPKGASLKLNPGIYTLFEPDESVEVTIN